MGLLVLKPYIPMFPDLEAGPTGREIMGMYVRLKVGYKIITFFCYPSSPGHRKTHRCLGKPELLPSYRSRGVSFPITPLSGAIKATPLMGGRLLGV